MHLNNFNYSVLGSNTSERIVFIHGLMAFAANWRKVASHLESEFQCLIYDQRGHGRSFKPETGYSPEEYAEDLNKMTDEFGWDKFHLVGHSMGGRNAMQFASQFPHKVRTLTIEDMGPDGDPKIVNYYQSLFDAIPTPFANRDEMKDFFATKFAQVFKPMESPQVLTLFLQSNTEEKENGQYDWKFSKSAIIETVNKGNAKNYWDELKNFAMPVLVVRGETSHLLKVETYEKMLQSNSNITGVVIPQAGHWIHYEKYQEFITELRNFLKLHNA